MTGIDTSRPVLIQEVAPRDGFQIEKCWIETRDKIAFINRLSRTGIRKIEVSSFVSPRAVPNLRDAAELFLNIERHSGVTYAALVPNRRGAENAMRAQVDEMNFVLSVSETHNRANMNMSPDASLAEFEAIAEMAAGRTPLNGTIATAFGCPFEGAQPSERVLDIAGAYVAAGAVGITLADTTGMAHPLQISQLCTAFKKRYPNVPLTLHLHNTRGLGIANCLAGYMAGVDRFDAALGGLGGCPFAPGATGNVCTEDLVHMWALMGVETGINLDALLALSRELPGLVGHALPGQVVQAGPSWQLHQKPGC
jgi:hydroxymethylglutaryl-CoA lyase